MNDLEGEKESLLLISFESVFWYKCANMAEMLRTHTVHKGNRASQYSRLRFHTSYELT